MSYLPNLLFIDHFHKWLSYGQINAREIIP